MEKILVDFYGKPDNWNGIVVSILDGSERAAVSKDDAIRLANNIFSELGDDWIKYDNFSFDDFNDEELVWVCFEMKSKFWYAVCRVDKEREDFDLVFEIEPSMWYASHTILAIKKLNKPLAPIL